MADAVNIPLGDQVSATVDAADAGAVGRYRWHHHKKDMYGAEFVFRNVDGRTAQNLPSFILGQFVAPESGPGWPRGRGALVVRYRDGNPLNCCRSNLDVIRE